MVARPGGAIAFETAAGLHLKQPLHIDGRDGVLTLSLNRPAKLNAIDEPMAQALLDALGTAMADPAVRAIVLRGEGRAFCAGRDVSRAPTERDLELVQAVVHGPKPVVAALHGWVVGAGLD